jgi:hypothetical protein
MLKVMIQKCMITKCHLLEIGRRGTNPVLVCLNNQTGFHHFKNNKLEENYQQESAVFHNACRIMN